MKKFLFLAVPLMFLFSSASAEISIQNDQKYFGDDGTLHIVGEIENGLNAPLNQIIVHATLYSNGNILDKIEKGTLVNTIMPEMRVPFDIMIAGDAANQVDDYTLDFNYKVSEPKNQVIEITSSEFARDSLDNMIITGTVANQGEITANTISIIATLYDRDGNVAAVSKTHTKVDYLRADDKAHFTVALPDKGQADQVVDYSLLAESEEYAAVPEFPLGSMLLLGASVSAYIVITKYSSRVITNLVSATNLR